MQEIISDKITMGSMITSAEISVAFLKVLFLKCPKSLNYHSKNSKSNPLCLKYTPHFFRRNKYLLCSQILPSQF